MAATGFSDNRWIGRADQPGHDEHGEPTEAWRTHVSPEAATAIGRAQQFIAQAEQTGWFMLYGAGVIASLLVYGVLQERVMTLTYGGELFAYSVFLVFVNRLFAVLFAVSMALAKGESLASKAPLWKYLAVSLSNVYASTCQYEALKYVSFPVQMLGKSFKMMPVMLWGIVISGKRYGVQDWAVAVCVTLGVTSFLLTGPVSSSVSTGNSMVGFWLLLAFLGLDGFTSTMQEKLFREHATSKYNQMMYVNMFSCVVSLATLLVAGDLLPALAFCTDHPAFVADALVLSGSAVSAQFFIYSQVKEFGALVYAATMNVRQVVSIMVSYATYQKTITPYQVASLFVVFGALFYKSFAGLAGDKSGERLPLLPKDAPEAASDGLDAAAAEAKAAEAAAAARAARAAAAEARAAAAERRAGGAAAPAAWWPWRS